jgi:nucleotide-binding universal stress UspA family protein
MFKHILIPVSPSHTSEYTASLAMGRHLLADGGQISILSVLEEVPSYIDAYLPADQTEKNIADVSCALKAEMDAEDINIYVVTGHPTNYILNWADTNSVDCIVISSHRPGFSDYLIGSTAARVVRHAQCNVVVLR